MSHDRYDINKLAFWISQENICPYLKDRKSRIIGINTHDMSAEMHSFLSCQHGFRRSRDVLYNNACQDCQECISVRIDVENFVYTKSWKRVLKKNSNAYYQLSTLEATDEQFYLLQDYLQFRHNESDMNGMNFDDYARMVENTGVETQIFEYRKHSDNRLVGVMIADVFHDGLSLVYSYYSSDAAKQGIGNFLVLSMIEYARKQAITYVYPGYYIRGNQSMRHKARYQNLQRLDGGIWKEFTPASNSDDQKYTHIDAYTNSDCIFDYDDDYDEEM